MVPGAPPFFFAARTAEAAGLMLLLRRAGVAEAHVAGVARRVMQLGRRACR